MGRMDGKLVEMQSGGSGVSDCSFYSNTGTGSSD